MIDTQPQPNRYRLPGLTPLGFIIEILVVIVLGLTATNTYTNMTPNTRIAGGEAEYLMAAQYTAATTLQTEGYLPAWQPNLVVGDPLLNNPFTFIFNPIQSWPSLFLLPNNGVKISIILMIIFTGLGGWTLGRVLGLRMLGRLLLAALCMGKGNIHAVLFYGFYPLSASQIYFPWLMVGVVGIFWYKHRRWPIALTAISMMLLVFAGLVWYAFPLTVLLFVLTVFHIVRLQRNTQSDSRIAWRVFIDQANFRRIALAAVFTVGLTAATLLPLLAYRSHIGVSTVGVDDPYEFMTMLAVYFVPEPNNQLGGSGVVAGYYSYVSPGWFALLVLGLAFIAGLRPTKWGTAHPRMIWIFMGGCFFMWIFYTLWGGGINPLIPIMYQVFPITTQFRHVERVLGVGSFLVAVMLAVLLDFAWCRLVLDSVWKSWVKQVQLSRLLSQATAIVLIVASAAAASSTLSKWGTFDGVVPENKDINACMDWLRATYPDEVLAVWSVGFEDITSYLRNNIRHWNIVLDFYRASPLPSTMLTNGYLTSVLPRYSQTFIDWDYSWESTYGYITPLPNGATYVAGETVRPCFLMRDKGEFPYVFSISADVMATKRTINVDYISAPTNAPVTPDQLDPSETTPILTYERHSDYIGIIIDGNPDHDQVVSVGELAYPGWQVSVNGQPARLEVVGGQIGVVVPKGESAYNILFQYRSPFLTLGLTITLLTTLFIALYLLRMERFIPVQVYSAVRSGMAHLTHFMLNPQVMGTDEVVDDDVSAFSDLTALGAPTLPALPDTIMDRPIEPITIETPITNESRLLDQPREAVDDKHTDEA